MADGVRGRVVDLIDTRRGRRDAVSRADAEAVLLPAGVDGATAAAASAAAVEGAAGGRGGGGSSGDGSAAAAATVGTAARRSLATAAWPCRWRFLPPSAAAARSRFVAASVSTTARLRLGTAAAPAGRPGCGSRMRGRSGGMRGGAAGDTADADRCRPEVKAVAKYFRSALLPLLMRDSGVAAVGADDDDVGALSSRHADGTPAAVAYRDPRAVAGGGGWAPCVCGVVGDSRR